MAKRMNLTCVGMFHRLTPSTIKKLAEVVEEVSMIECRLEREPDNLHDANAVKVVAVEEPWVNKNTHGGMQIGYVARASASVIAPVMDAGDWDFNRVWLVAVNPDQGEGSLVAERKP